MTVSAAVIDDEFVSILTNMGAKQRWAMEVAMEIRQAERERWEKVRDSDTVRMLRDGTWAKFVEDLKADARRAVMGQQARRAKTATDEWATKTIKSVYPDYRIKETYQIGSEVYATLVGPGFAVLNVRYASGKVYQTLAELEMA